MFSRRVDSWKKESLQKDFNFCQEMGKIERRNDHEKKDKNWRHWHGENGNTTCCTDQYDTSGGARVSPRHE